MLDIHFDSAVLGTGSIYRSSRTGVHRYVSELVEGLLRREDLRLKLVSFGRGRWIDLVARQAVRREFPRALEGYLGWTGTKSSGEALSRGILALRDRGWVSETVAAGLFQVAGGVLCRKAPAIENGVYHSPAHPLPHLPRSVARVVTIHDTIPHRFPQWCRTVDNFRRILDSIDPSRDHVVCDSHSTRSDLLEILPIEPDRVHTVHLATSGGFAPIEENARIPVLERHGIRGRYLLSVATLEPRKNLDGLLRAFAALAHEPGCQDLSFVLIGAKGWMMEALEKQLSSLGELRRRVVFPGFVADDELPALYSGCQAFVYPSLYEGFGLPPLEAMACGAPAVCLANSSLPEVVGDSCPLVGENTPEALAQGILHAMALPRDQRGHAPSRSQAARFHWDTTVERTVEVYRRARESSRG